MLRTNLATRPFYNERAVHLVLGLAALLVLALTIFNAVRIVSLSRQNTDLARSVNEQRREAVRLTQEATRIRRGINQAELNTTVAAAQEANALIDQRTFSWTEFFNRIEATLPPNVMLTTVQPSFDNTRTYVTMGLLARGPEDIDEFVEQLEATGAFHNVLPVRGDQTDDGLHRAGLRAIYTGTAVAPVTTEPEPAPKPAGEEPTATKPTGAGR